MAFIIGLSSGVVLLSLPDRASPFEETGTEVSLLLEELEQRATLTGVAHGIELTDLGYRPVVRSQGAWVDTMQGDQALPDGVVLEASG